MELTGRPTLSRRWFLRTGLATLSGYQLLPMLRPLNVRAEGKVSLKGTAEYCIFLFLNGGASQLDTFDLKEGRWTPADYDVRLLKPGILWPFGQFPRLATHIEKIAIARSIQAWESSHVRGIYYMQVGHSFSPARQKEVPSVGAVVAYEFLRRRKLSDFLPPFVSMNFSGSQLVKEGCLPGETAPLSLDLRQQTPFVIPANEKSLFDRRWALLQQLEAQGIASEDGAHPLYQQWESYYNGAHELMASPQIARILAFSEDEHVRYGSSSLGDACLAARNLLLTNAGTHYISISHNGWDLHANMFDRAGKVNHYTLCKELDDALSSLLEDLAKNRGEDGRTFLDKTLLVCMGEFGRTGGDLTINKGRDHNRLAQTALFAGAGVQGGRAFGVTDERGEKVVNAEWNNKSRAIYTEDIFATAYSLLGIDWTKKIETTPSGRAFEYLEPVSSTEFIDITPIEALFS
jgi:uncharacterized protein (DUF1501 family)